MTDMRLRETAVLQPPRSSPRPRPSLVTAHRRHHIHHLGDTEGEACEAYRQQHHRTIWRADRGAAAGSKYRRGPGGDGGEEGQEDREEEIKASGRAEREGGSQGAGVGEQEEIDGSVGRRMYHLYV